MLHFKAAETRQPSLLPAIKAASSHLPVHTVTLSHITGRAFHSLELAIEISLTSFGSSHTLRRPQLRTEAASRFCSFRDTILPSCLAKRKEREGRARARLMCRHTFVGPKTYALNLPSSPFSVLWMEHGLTADKQGPVESAVMIDIGHGTSLLHCTESCATASV